MKTIVNKPWGSYQIIDEGNNYLVKNILVKPYSKLSLQSHKHRSEHWVVVQGTAEVTINDKINILEPNKIEFWQNKPNRLHLRELFLWSPEGWKKKILSP